MNDKQPASNAVDGETQTPLSRRACLQRSAKVAVAAGVASLSAGCSRLGQRLTHPAPVELDTAFPRGLAQSDGEKAARLLNRMAFGARPGDVARVTKMGHAAYIEEQLNPVDQEELLLQVRLRGLEVLRSNAIELRDLQETEVLRQLQQAAILRAVYSQYQLRERLVDFWSNHFNIYARKGLGTYLITADDIAVIRTHALGTFPDLLRASAHSPAMLSYLDNSENRRGVANENYARELLELHTLGVGGGYSQSDVQEVARCLTGWTIENRFLYRRGTFRFDEARHDNGVKTVLGTRIAAGGGQSDGDKVLSILSSHPATAHFIASKLCRYFLGQENAQWARRLAHIYTQTKGNISAMLRPLLLSEELLHSAPIVKRPFDYLVSALRTLNADSDGGALLQKHLENMGQTLWSWPMPDGYPDSTAAWSGSVLSRWNFAFALCSRDIPNTTIDGNILRQLSA
ncbi:MAG: hypothetical protein JWN98_249, partial [Abditibacteriota bacterium]|nr:hypothetical protein [Abditibacteriota bacterium]